MVAAALALAAVERGAVADRDERVLQARAARVVRVDVAGRDGRDAERRGELLERGVAARVAALVRALELDVERAGERAREPGGAVRVERRRARGRAQPERQTSPSACSATNSSVVAGGSSSRSRPGDARARVRVGEDPAEVRVAALRLAEERDVRAVRASVDLGAGDRAERRSAFAAWANSSEP